MSRGAPTPGPFAVRWTIGDVSPWGFEALRLSLWGAWKVFGPDARYVVCVNSLPRERAQSLTGAAPPGVEWRDASGELPEFLRRHLDANLAEGMGWKFAPLRVAPDAYELALDNDCILWAPPRAIRAWFEPGNERRAVLAEDVRRMFGVFSDLCGPEPRNGGIRGLPPGFDFGRTLQAILKQHPVVLSSELDEQGLQAAALARLGEPLVVRVEEVTICSPFPPHRPHLGTCGAHFAGLNAKQLPWDYEGRPAVELIREHWARRRTEIERRVGLPRAAATVLHRTGFEGEAAAW